MRLFSSLVFFILCVFSYSYATAADSSSMADAIRAELATLPKATSPALRPAVGMTLDEAAKGFYSLRQYTPAWAEGEAVTALLEGIKATIDDGLDPEDYALSRLAAAWTALKDKNASPAQKAAFDVLATRAFIHALFHLNRGKLDPVDFAPRQVNPHDELMRIQNFMAAGDVAAAFAAARPQSPLYGRLRDALKDMRAVAARGGWPTVPDGPSLKPGMTDARVSAVRARLVASGYLPQTTTDADFFDAELERAVKAFQKDHLLDTDGVVGAKTRAEMNITAAGRVDQLRVNLERARQLLGTVQQDFVLVDIAAYRVVYYREGKAIWESRAVVGRPYRQTPEFRSEITRVTLNPDWTVPPTIFRDDMVPQIRKNPNYLADNHMQVVDAQGNQIDPASVDWKNPRGIYLRQQPGPWNALGRVVIRFANAYAVYLHDTPNHNLFGKTQRDFSSGCIRVENPFELVHLLFNANDEALRQQIRQKLDSGKTVNMALPKPVTIFLVYYTVGFGDDGRVLFKSDIYNRDARILTGLNAPAGI